MCSRPRIRLTLRGAVVITVLIQAAPAAAPVVATVAHGVFHMLEAASQAHFERERLSMIRVSGILGGELDGLGSGGQAHTHGPGTAPHVHAPLVDFALEAASDSHQGDEAPEGPVTTRLRLDNYTAPTRDTIAPTPSIRVRMIPVDAHPHAVTPPPPLVPPPRV